MSIDCDRESTDGQLERPRALLMAFACVPGVGSEEGVGWNRVLQSARFLDCDVICEGRMGAAAIERYQQQHGPVPGVTFHCLPLTDLEQRGCRSKLTYYFAYRRWQQRAFALARQLHERRPFDLVHQVNIIGYREPSETYRLGAPFVWGPVGGVQNLPWRFIPGLGLTGAVRESVRNVLNRIQFRYSRRVRQAAARAEVILAANGENAAGMARLAGRSVLQQWETGLPELPACEPRRFPHDRPIHILWTGTAHAAKGLHLTLRALAALPGSVPWRLRVCGDRSERRPLRKLAERLGIGDRIEWYGWLTREQYYEKYCWADVFVFSSLRDTSGNVMFEALSYGVPVVCLDHQGAAEIIDASCGLKIPVESPRQVCRDLAAAMVRLASEPECYERLSQGALERAAGLTWVALGEQMRGVYEQVLGYPLSERSSRAATESLAGIR